MHAEGTGDDPKARPSRRIEVTAAAVCVVLTGLLLVGAYDIEVRAETAGVGPRSWPTLLGWVGLAMSVVLLAVAALRPPPERDELEVIYRRGVLRCVAAVVLAAAYIAVWDATDFRLATPVFLAAVVAVFGGRSWQSLLLYPVVTTAAVYALFHTVLQVPL